jgi:hypothetical protein
MALDSVAAFTERAIELQLEEHLDRFKTNGWTTLAKLAFATPQQGNEEEFERRVLIPGLGAKDHADVPSLRRLFFEAFLLASADLKRRSESTADNATRTMPTAERRERYKKVQNRLIGLELKDDLDVSHRLIERCVDMADANTLVHLPLELCTKRSDEVRGIHKDPMWQTVPDPASGSIIFKKLRDELRSPVDGQFALNFAFMRRGLALEMADILSHENHEKLKSKYISAMMKQLMDGYKPVTVEQVYTADIEFWICMAEATQDGIRRSGAKERPCDAAFNEVLRGDTFLQAMAPRQGASKQQNPPRFTLNLPGNSGFPALADTTSQGHPLTSGGRLGRKRKAAGKGTQLAITPQAEVANRDQAALANRVRDAFSSAPSTGKGNGKASTPGKGPRVPVALVGLPTRSSAATGSKRMCFGFNLGTCDAAQPGADCVHGSHLCMRLRNGEACSRDHPQTQCS